jgi:predicted RNA-binding protein YlqC (UPF0109 family)
MSEISIDQQFIEYVVRSLVGNPDAVSVERIIDEKGVLLTLTVDPEDLGRVIGKRGATAQSLRTLLRALGTKQESRFNLKIVDNGIPREEREAQKESQNQVNGNYHSPQRDETRQERQEEDIPKNDGGGWNSGSSDDSSAAQDAANDSGEEESAIERTRRELMDLDDLDV